MLMQYKFIHGQSRFGNTRTSLDLEMEKAKSFFFLGMANIITYITKKDNTSNGIYKREYKKYQKIHWIWRRKRPNPSFFNMLMPNSKILPAFVNILKLIEFFYLVLY
jgi:hypothetical protein